jgi:hypothetical protein
MLTDTKLRALRPRDRLYRVADANGLCVEVTPAGSRLWRYRYRFNGRASMLALGEYPHVSPVDARRRRDEARTALAAGASPVVAARAAALRRWSARRTRSVRLRASGSTRTALRLLPVR